ncbi:jg20198 [Pararge aegeria aegeria]|uniref:Jg20198 protein n=1 Tax=Pararge aegeria aegeria TaxID=348720 RepID=A0A8S4S2B0_9NEOP|nr:jg20198 [Pararge aegeria aegeria]
MAAMWVRRVRWAVQGGGVGGLTRQSIVKECSGSGGRYTHEEVTKARMHLRIKVRREILRDREREREKAYYQQWDINRLWMMMMKLLYKKAFEWVIDVRLHSAFEWVRRVHGTETIGHDLETH